MVDSKEDVLFKVGLDINVANVINYVMAGKLNVMYSQYSLINVTTYDPCITGVLPALNIIQNRSVLDPDMKLKLEPI